MKKHMITVRHGRLYSQKPENLVRRGIGHERKPYCLVLWNTCEKCFEKTDRPTVR